MKIPTGMKLSEISRTGRFRILSYEPSQASEYRLMEMGLVPGTVISWVRHSPLRDPICLEVQGRLISVRKRDLGNIQVEQVVNP